MHQQQSAHLRPWTGIAISGALIITAVFLVYSAVLDNFYFPIDDPLLVWTSARGIEATPHFRPLYTPWNGLLWSLFGLKPFGWYLAGIMGHAIGAVLAAILVTRVSGSRLQGTATGLAFALFYTSHEVVFWIAANSTLFSVVPVLAAGLAWDFYLTADPERPARRGTAYLFAMLFLAISAGFKEDCVLAGPLFIGLDFCRNGPRAVLHWRSLLRYAPPAIFAAAYLTKSYQPALWADLPTVGEYSFHIGLIPELFQNFAWLFWPKRVTPDEWTTLSVLAGVALALSIGITGIRLRHRSPLILLGLILALLGLLPALPGPFPIAGSRYSYSGSIGATMMIGAALCLLWKMRGGAAWRVLLTFGFLGWLALQGLSIRTVESWRFEAKCARLEKMVESSPPVTAQAESFVINPAVMNAHDYLYALLLFNDLPRETMSFASVPYGPEFSTRLQSGGDLDPTAVAVFGCRNDGEVFRIRTAADAPIEQWTREAIRRVDVGKEHTIAVVRYAAGPGQKKRD
jgi:hypothetical protein